MKKSNLTKLAMMGLVSGLLAGCSGADKPAEESTGNMGDMMGKKIGEMAGMNAENLMSQLNAESKKLFEDMDKEHQMKVLKVASQKCAGSNECAGLNACKSATNECAGMASCKGNGGCAFTDKNLAVKLVYKKMMEKRGKMNY